MSKLDKDALLTVLEFIETHPDKWNQSMWANECRTQFCFAGWACVMAGNVPTKEEENDNNWVWRDNAKEILGLRDWDAYLLFDGRNTLYEIRRQVGRLVDENVG